MTLLLQLYRNCHNILVVNEHEIGNYAHFLNILCCENIQRIRKLLGKKKAKRVATYIGVCSSPVQSAVSCCRIPDVLCTMPVV